MTILETLNTARKRGKNIPEIVLATEVILAFCLEKDRSYLISNSDLEVDLAVQDKFYSLLDRFLAGEPVAYLINNKEFFGLDFYVDDRVLIPRPETELLVEKVLEFIKLLPGSVRILDVGTGSGCIAVAIAKNAPGVKIVAVDISADALNVAKKNALLNGVNSQIDFVESDLLSNVKGDFDIIVANLPYIGLKKHNLVSRETLDFEPHLALFGGDDGLILYERLFSQIFDKKIKPRFILGEFGYLQSDDVQELLNKFFVQSSWVILKDLASIDRVFVVTSES